MSCIVCRAITLSPEKAFYAGIAYARLSATNPKLARHLIREKLCSLHANEAFRALNDKALVMLAVATVAEGVPRTELSFKK